MEIRHGKARGHAACRPLLFAVALAACLLLSAAPRALAAPPNDNFANAESLGDAPMASATGTNSGATKELGEPNHSGDQGGASVWYSWTAPSTGTVRVSACSSSFDTVVGVYTGPTVALLAAVANNNDFCGTRSKVAFSAVEGVEYRIAVDGRRSLGVAAQGPIKLNLTPNAPPPNDDFDAAAELGSTSNVSVTGHNFDATKEPGEPTHAGGDVGGASVWFRWTAPESGRYQIETCGSASTLDTLLAVYAGSAVGSLTKLQSSDDHCDLQSRVALTATAGSNYRIAVDGANWFGTPRQGELELKITPLPDQDGDGISDAQDNCLTTPNPSQANNDSDAEGDACDSDDDNDTVADASDNCSTVANASQVNVDGDLWGDACDDDDDNDGDPDGADNCPTTSNSNQANSDGDGQGDACDADDDGDGVLDDADLCPLEHGTEPDGCPPPSPPENDDLADAMNLQNATFATAYGDNFDATKEPGEPDHGSDIGGASVWFQWAPSTTAQYEVDTCGSDFDTLLGVYTGSSVGALTEVAGDDDGCGLQSQVTIDATAGTTYWIAVDGYNGDFGAPDEGFVALTIARLSTQSSGAPPTPPPSTSPPRARVPISTPPPARKPAKCKTKSAKPAKKAKCKRKGKRSK